jgi:hypothetical protein
MSTNAMLNETHGMKQLVAMTNSAQPDKRAISSDSTLFAKTDIVGSRI